MTAPRDLPTEAASVRPVLQTLARLIATDRRAVILATAQAEILLSNAAARRKGLVSGTILNTLDWVSLCTSARRAGSIAASLRPNATQLEGELVYLPLGTTDAYLLRLAETDQEATVLRNRSRTATLLRVSHDLRTPIQSLLSAADTVFSKSGDQTAASPRTLERMKHAAEIALTHIDNVIKVIRGEMTSADLQVDDDFDLVQEARSIVEMIEPIATARGAEIGLSAVPDGEIWLRGPVRFVRALLQNMIDNAVKHGGARTEITLYSQPGETEEHATDVIVEIADCGGGLSDIQKSRLLGAFDVDDQPANGAQTAKDPGGQRSSAGLNVLLHALGQLGGRMEVLDRGEDGAPVRSPSHAIAGTILKARFSLPPAARSIDPAEIDEGSEARLAGFGLLVVEDSPSSRDWLVETLRQAGASVKAVGSGASALEILRSAPAVADIDLLLTDMTLPGMSGIELVRRIRKEQASGAISWHGEVLALTAHVDERLRAACLGLGILKVLEKPIRHRQLTESIREALAKDDPAEARIADGASDQDDPAQRPDGTADHAQALDHEVVSDLIKQMNLAGAEGFMRRALSEAEAVLDAICSQGVQEDTGRMLHAATGACGLTGLVLLERQLRLLEAALERGVTELEHSCAAVRNTIAVTSAAIDGLR